MEAKNPRFHHAMQDHASESVFRMRRQDIRCGEISIVLSLAKKFGLGVVDNSPRLRTMTPSRIEVQRTNREANDEEYGLAARLLLGEQHRGAKILLGARQKFARANPLRLFGAEGCACPFCRDCVFASVCCVCARGSDLNSIRS